MSVVRGSNMRNDSWSITLINNRARKSEVTQSCPTLCDPMHCSPPGSSVQGILQARILEWVAISFSRGSSKPQRLNRGLPHCRQTLYHLSHQGSYPGLEPTSPTLRVHSLPSETPGKPKNTGVGSLSTLQGIFPTQELNWGLLHCRWILYQLSYQGSPIKTRVLCKYTFQQPQLWTGTLICYLITWPKERKWSCSVVSKSLWLHGL